MANTATQWLFDRMMAMPASTQGSYARMARAMSAAVIHIASRVLHDPIVAHKVYGAQLIMPMSHALPRILLRHPDYSANLGRIATAFYRKYPSLTMIDVGANIGDTIAVVRRLSPIPMLCIDGDPNYFCLLQHNAEQWSDIELERAYVSITSGTIPVQMESRDGSGHLAKNQHYLTEIMSLPDILDHHPRFHSSKLLKIDTDGFDTLIVKGAGTFLQSARPAVYLEYDPFFFQEHDSTGFEVFDFLRRNAYTTALFFWNTGEFYAEASLLDTKTLRKLHAACSNQGGKHYFDVCIFHQDDLDLCTEIRANESALAGK